jgi:hypothetical protein
MWTRAVLLVAALAACRGKAEPPPAPKPAVASGTDPWIVADAPPETAATRKARADAAIARVGEIVPKLAKLRHLELQHPIPAEYQTADDFKAFVHREVDKERAHDAELAAAYVQIGLLPEPIDLGKALEQAFATQAAAYYDPAQKKFFIVMVPDSPAMLDAASAHELTHGLQDQHFDLKKYMAEDAHGASTLDDDAQVARRFVVEGDATFTMFLYMLADSLHVNEPTPAVIAAMRTQLENFTNMDTNAMVDAMSSQVGIGSGDLQSSAKAMHDIPLTILVPMVDSYLKGALLALAAYEKGGWPAIDALYAHPPDSTEQVLHPKDHLISHVDRPKRVTLPKLDGYTEVTSNVLGELQWHVYFALWKHTGDENVSRNWGGDRYGLLRKGDAPVALIATVWDTAYDAKMFSEAYSSTTEARMAAKAHHGKIWVKLVGDRVFIVDGGDDPTVMDRLVAGAKIER